MKIASLLGSVLAALVVAFAARSVPAQEAMRVAIPLFPTVAFPVLVGADKGFFQKEGLTIEPIRINSAPTTYQALISGDVHAVVGAPTGLLPSNLQGADIVSVGSWDNLVPYVWVTREKITDIRDLRGKKVGVNRAGSKPWLVIHVLLQDAGLDPVKDLTLLQMGGGSQERVAAFNERRHRRHPRRRAPRTDHGEKRVFRIARQADAVHEWADRSKTILSRGPTIDAEKIRQSLFRCNALSHR